MVLNRKFEVANAWRAMLVKCHVLVLICVRNCLLRRKNHHGSESCCGMIFSSRKRNGKSYMIRRYKTLLIHFWNRAWSLDIVNFHIEMFLTQLSSLLWPCANCFYRDDTRTDLRPYLVMGTRTAVRAISIAVRAPVTADGHPYRGMGIEISLAFHAISVLLAFFPTPDFLLSAQKHTNEREK